MKRLLRWMFGCPHADTTTVRGRVPDTYVVCLKCGREIRYDWTRMTRCA